MDEQVTVNHKEESGALLDGDPGGLLDVGSQDHLRFHAEIGADGIGDGVHVRRGAVHRDGV